ncbi:hypothetical protein [Absidia glauca]|uniref:Uncharacterized protein n=1 Tax=Absidia glauca TaxID=4829 RepID=A0A168M0B7_ABSGL|nr:hypothetical protein [Absidia glauca]
MKDSMDDESLNNTVHQVLSEYALLEVKDCGDTHFFLDHPSSWRMNLCAVSQMCPTKYFIAVNNEIRVYGLAGGHIFTKRPLMTLKPSTQPDFLINAIKVGPMMFSATHNHRATEILVAVGDNGEIFAWNTHNLFISAVDGDKDLREQPFLRKVNSELAENEGRSGGVSTWGIALHVHGLLAVSANNYRITIYNLWKKQSPVGEVSNYLGDRQRVDLAGHLHNVPCIDFDSSGRYLASGSIDMTCRLWDLSTLQQVGQRTMTRTLDGDAWIWTVKFISPGNFKRVRCDNTRLSNMIRQKLNLGRSTSVSDLHLVHSATYPIYQLDMGQMFSRLNTEDYSDDDDVGASQITRPIMSLTDNNDDNDGWADPPDITRLISLSNFLSQHYRQQQLSQTEGNEEGNNESSALELELEEASPGHDDLLRQYAQYEENDPHTDNDNDNVDDIGQDWRAFNDDLDNESHYAELYDTYTDQEGHPQEWGDPEESDLEEGQITQGFVGFEVNPEDEDDLDSLYEAMGDPFTQDWEDRYLASIGGNDDDDDLGEMSFMDRTDPDQYNLQDRPGWADESDGLGDNPYDPAEGSGEDYASQLTDEQDGWGDVQGNHRDDYDDLMLEDGSWMDDQTRFPWHWTGIRSSDEQDQSDSYDDAEESAQQHQESDVTHDQTQSDLLEEAEASDNETKSNTTKPSSFAIKSLNPTVLGSPPICLSICSKDHSSKIPPIFEATELRVDPNTSSLDNTDTLKDYLMITNKKDAYLLNVSHEPSSTSSPSYASAINDAPNRHTMETVQRERYVVSHADSRTDERLNMMERLSFVEWIPELELCVMASQKGCVALMRILQVQLDGTAHDDGLQTCIFNNEKYLPMHGLQNSVLYGMTVHRLPSDDESRGFSCPVYQLLLLYLDGTMRSYLISKNQSQLPASLSSSQSLLDLTLIV